MHWVKKRVVCVFSPVLERLRLPKCTPNAKCNIGLIFLWFKKNQKENIVVIKKNESLKFVLLVKNISLVRPYLT